MKKIKPIIILALLGISIGVIAEQISTTYGGSSTKPGLLVQRARGHAQAQETLQSGDVLNGIYARGFDGTSFSTSNSIAVELQAAEAWTTAAKGTKVVIYTTPKQSTTAAAALTINGAGLGLLSDAAPRTNLTPSAAGTLVWNSQDGQLCVSTAAVVNAWVQVADGSTACSH